MNTKDGQETQGNTVLPQTGKQNVPRIRGRKVPVDEGEDTDHLSDKCHARFSPDPTHPARRK